MSLRVFYLSQLQEAGGFPGSLYPDRRSLNRVSPTPTTMTVTHCENARAAMPYNRSFDTDTHRHCVAKRVDKPTPCGAAPARAGQLKR